MRECSAAMGQRGAECGRKGGFGYRSQRGGGVIKCFLFFGGVGGNTQTPLATEIWTQACGRV